MIAYKLFERSLLNMESLLIKIFIEVVAKLRCLERKVISGFYFLFSKYLVSIYYTPESLCILLDR